MKGGEQNQIHRLWRNHTDSAQVIECLGAAARMRSRRLEKLGATPLSVISFCIRFDSFDISAPFISNALVWSRIILDNHALCRPPLTRLAALATLSPKGARGLSRVTRDRTLA